MRFIRLMTATGPRVGLLDTDGAPRAAVFADTGTVIDDLQQVIDAGRGASGRIRGGEVISGTLMAPHVPGRNVFCVGRNYRRHAAEFARSGFDASWQPSDAETPSSPVVFTKAAACIIASGGELDPHIDLTSALDYEGEIAVIIGRRATKVCRADAMKFVWGYTLINDVTARDLQRDHKQWFIGKSLDTFCPIGPWAVSADEIDITDLILTTRVNGELRQKASTSDLIFDVPCLIEVLSAGITLEPGDVIATGTPAGVGAGLVPPQFLAPGDAVVISAQGLGELRNIVGPSSAAPTG